MYNKVLIISDNSKLCSAFKSIINDLSLDINRFIFATSPFSNTEHFELENIIKYDLRIEDDVQSIVSSYDLVFSIHCKQIFPPELVNNIKCINIHPGYNPLNRGWYPQVFSIIHKLPIGATIHEIDEKLDNGGIIVREQVEKYSYDTSETLYERIVKKELNLLMRHLVDILNGNYTLIKPEGKGNVFLKKDFNNLLKINLDEESRVGDFIDKLRALTHGNFNNAFFIDKKTGKKIFIGIKLNQDE